MADGGSVTRWRHGGGFKGPGAIGAGAPAEAGGAPRRRSTTRVLTAAVLTLAAVVGTACSSDSGTAPGAAGRGASPTSEAGSTRPGGADEDSVPPPSKKITGTVDGGVHHGDLRFFLLPIPPAAEPSGAVTGDRISLEEAAIGHQEGTLSALRDAGFRQAAHRAYHTADGAWEVDVKLAQLGSPASARSFAQRSAPKGRQETVPGDPRARAARLDSASAESTGALVAVSYQGDVHITLTITGASPATPAMLAQLLARQYTRLRTAR